MTQFIASSAYFGVILTLGLYLAASAVNRRYPNVLTNPFLLTTAAVILILTMVGIPNQAYQHSAGILNYLLVPATVCFAVPIYRNIRIIRQYKWTVTASILLGAALSVMSVIGLAKIFGLNGSIIRSMVPQSSTTAIAMGISQEIGGIIEVTMLVVALAGVIGNIFARWVIRAARIQSPIARGLAIGTSSHIIGTAKAFEIGKTEGVFSSLSIAITGIILAIIAPVIIAIFGI